MSNMWKAPKNVVIPDLNTEVLFAALPTNDEGVIGGEAALAEAIDNAWRGPSYTEPSGSRTRSRSYSMERRKACKRAIRKYMRACKRLPAGKNLAHARHIFAKACDRASRMD